jgi:hypothetical protein
LELFKKKALENGMSEKDFDAIVWAIKEAGTPSLSPLNGLTGGVHNECFNWSKTFEKNLNAKLHETNGSAGLVGTLGRRKRIFEMPLGSTGNKRSDIPYLNRILPFIADVGVFAYDLVENGPCGAVGRAGRASQAWLGQDHTLFEFELKDGTFWYMDFGITQNVLNGKTVNDFSHPDNFTPADKLPKDWKKTNRQGE